MQTEYTLNKSDKKIRKHWLISSLTQWLLFPILFYVLSIVLFKMGFIVEDTMTEYSIYAFSSILFLLIVFCFAYLGNGNKYLIFSLFMGGFKTIKSVGGIVAQPLDALTISALVIGLSTYIWWILASIELLHVNNKINAVREESNEYLKSIYAMRKVDAVVQLTKHYSILKEKWPKYKSASLKEYNLLKKNLTKKTRLNA